MPLDPKEHNHLLRLRVAQLEAVLAGQGLDLPPEPAEALRCLSGQELALYQLVAQAKGRCLTRFDIDHALPARDHAEVRSYNHADVVVCRIRKKLGADVIINERGRGYRIGRGVS